MSAAKTLAVWQNVLLSIPIGIVAGSVAAILTMGLLIYVVEPIERPNFWSFQELWPIAGGGALIGILTFPIAYATVARTNSVFSIVPAGFIGTVVGAWIGLGSLVAMEHSPRAAEILDGNGYTYVLLLTIVAMFGACAWAAARERRKNRRLLQSTDD